MEHVSGHVYPYDLDWNRHMNNTKYLSSAKLARLCALLEAGCLTPPWEVVSYFVSYSKELKLFQAFTIATQVGCACGFYLSFYSPMFLT